MDELAVTGSKLDGTGLEKEHIGQIHVADVGGTGEVPWDTMRPWPSGRGCLGEGDRVACAKAGLTHRFWVGALFSGFG